MLGKILRAIKVTLQVMCVALIGFGISLGIHMAVQESLRFPSSDELQSLSNISDDLSSRETRAVNLSRQSIVYVLSGSPSSSGFSKMSGTYVEHRGGFYVITAAHGVRGECGQLFVATSDEAIYDCIRYIIVDPYLDYAVIQIEKLPDRTPIRLSEGVPSNREWHHETSVLNEVVYTGYPNGLGPLTFRGSIAGLSERNYIYLHSYAWPGSSGSGVFSMDGNLIGIVIALNVGFTAAGYDVLEDLVIVTPLFMIDWEAVYDTMNEPPPSSDTGDTAE